MAKADDKNEAPVDDEKSWSIAVDKASLFHIMRWSQPIFFDVQWYFWHYSHTHQIV